MASINESIVIARSAILTHQARMAVISHNIANVNTPGYHRQKAVLGTNPAINPTIAEARHYDIGTGVRMIDVIQTVNDMKEALLVDQKSTSSYNDTLANALGDIEALLAGSTDSSLALAFQDFWSAWQDVANNADVLSFRSVLVEKSVALTNQIKTMATQINTVRSQICAGTPPNVTGILADEVASVNTLATQIQDLNSQITYLQNASSTHDLRDKRTELIRQLSELVNISVATDGTITIDGETLVSGDGVTRNDLTIADSDTPISLTLNGNAVVPTAGSIAAWIDTAATLDAATGSLKLRFDTLADTLMDQVNTLHQSGYDLDGEAGIAFFTGTDNDGDGLIDADTLAVNNLIYDSSNPMNNDPRLIAAAATRFSAGPPPIPNPEDGAMALQIADLASLNVAALNSMRFNEYIPEALSTLGSRVSTAQSLTNDSEAIINVIEDSIQEETGVNLDEELIEMMSAQRAYQAASRLFTVLDDMMDLIINGLGT